MLRQLVAMTTASPCHDAQTYSLQLELFLNKLVWFYMGSNITYAMRFSSLLNHRTSLGVPRMKKHKPEATMVKAPRKSEILRQASIPPTAEACFAIPYIINEKQRPKRYSDDCQRSERCACSSVRYHEPVTNRNPGEMAHSKKPCRARMAIS